MIETRGSFCALETRIHPEKEVSGAIDRGDHESIVIRETIGQLALERRWSEVWEIADSMSREVSILIDRRNMVFVDVGTAGRVILNPPEGSEVPFRLWVHTHPRDAYWSSTDRDSLAHYSARRGPSAGFRSLEEVRKWAQPPRTTSSGRPPLQMVIRGSGPIRQMG